MTRYFNTEGLCIPEEHYMVRLDDRLEKIKRLYVKRGKYFVINRGRQYGKTTTLRALKEYLKDEYLVVSLDFQGISTEEYRDEYTFTRAFMRMFAERFKRQETTAGDKFKEFLDGQEQRKTLSELFTCLSGICAACSRPIVLMIDEVDSASNNQVFIDFLAQLRGYYLEREKRPIFHSVILAGVYDIKNLKLKIRSNEEHQYNSPWNIAADFEIDMSFSAGDIAGMLREYEHDYSTGMDIQGISQMIWEYTEGYPYLVSRICQFIDEQVAGSADYPDRSAAWSREGILVAVKKLLEEQNTLFDDMGKKLSDVKGLDHMIRLILFHGKQIPYNPDDEAVRLGSMFGYLKKKDGVVAVSNRIFETRLYNRYLSENIMEDALLDAANMGKNQFIADGCLNMDLVMEKFMLHFTEIYGDSEVCFLEENGRRIFLTYLRPIINGTGNYYVEART